jgi:hypothetical protein
MVDDAGENLGIKREKIFSWLDTHWKTDRKCPICQNSQWNVNLSSGVMQLVRSKIIQQDETFPFVIINCRVCGYSFLMNEVIMGIAPPIIPPDKKPDNEEKEK